jgi:hypothetical protein
MMQHQLFSCSTITVTWNQIVHCGPYINPVLEHILILISVSFAGRILTRIFCFAQHCLKIEIGSFCSQIPALGSPITESRRGRVVEFRIIIKGPGATAAQTVRTDFIRGTVINENCKPTRISSLNLVPSHRLVPCILNCSRNDIYIRNIYFRRNKHSAQPNVIKLID